jgi:hypothetical protein
VVAPSYPIHAANNGLWEVAQNCKKVEPPGRVSSKERQREEQEDAPSDEPEAPGGTDSQWAFCVEDHALAIADREAAAHLYEATSVQFTFR